jgi:serine phosphatase RsbU (regulator of sigma subunit)/pSer/pThr/pTyr-binding forkhead associated (FHA) protein
MAAWLHVDRGDLQGQIIYLDRDRMVLGRKPNCDAVISSNELVSRWHAYILRKDDRYVIEDPKSRNRTYVNGEEVRPGQQVVLKHKDRIRICDFEATFYDGITGEDSSSTKFEAALIPQSDHKLQTQPAAKLAALLEITASLSKTLQLESQLQEVTNRLLKLFAQADRCFLILVEEETGNLRPIAVSIAHGGNNFFSHTIVRECLKTNKALLLREPDKLPGSTDSVIESQMRSVMCVPLSSGEDPPFGVIQLDTQNDRNRFTEDDLKLLCGVAQQAGVALENARYHELLLAQARVKSELEMARQVQLNFLPPAVPELPGYEFYAYYKAAREVGGDYYDFIPLPDQRLAITVGDVAGKGMPAALLMARFSSEARFCFLTERDPAAAVARLNDQLHPVTSPMDRFVTLAAAVLDPLSHTLSLINAGHPRPLWYRPGDRTFGNAIPLEDEGALLGTTRGCRYQGYDIRLQPGDCLVLFSDGVTDAQSVQMRSFRMKGIHAVLQKDAPGTPAALGQRIIRAVEKHAREAEQYDDITLICLGRSAAGSA